MAANAIIKEDHIGTPCVRPLIFFLKTGEKPG
jgi:hypothetical protein